jgi:hypothetical protein
MKAELCASLKNANENDESVNMSAEQVLDLFMGLFGKHTRVNRAPSDDSVDTVVNSNVRELTPLNSEGPDGSGSSRSGSDTKDLQSRMNSLELEENASRYEESVHNSDIHVSDVSSDTTSSRMNSRSTSYNPYGSPVQPVGVRAEAQANGPNSPQTESSSPTSKQASNDSTMNIASGNSFYQQSTKQQQQVSDSPAISVDTSRDDKVHNGNEGTDMVLSDSNAMTASSPVAASRLTEALVKLRQVSCKQSSNFDKRNK